VSLRNLEGAILTDRLFRIEDIYNPWFRLSIAKVKSETKPVDELTPEQVHQIEEEGAVIKPEAEPELKPNTMRIDLHCHTEASPDSSSPFEEIPDRCVEKGITVQAITDHNSIWGAQKLQEIVHAREDIPLRIIVGEEISTAEGELIGLFLKEKVDPGLTPEETVIEIKKQGGLVLLPHGFDPLKRWHLRVESRKRITPSIDIVETFNSRISRPRWNRAAVKWAEEQGVPMSAGSDAHTIADIGNAWVEVPARPIDSPDALLAALQDGVPMGVWTHPVIAFLFKMVDRTRRKVSRWLE
jgi:predicted metal-dependent phosphoesterase TrpH